MDELNGFLNVLKPPGMTSARVVGYARRLAHGAKVGHAGTLDPEAAGVLPLMLGKAARLFDYMQDKQKAYIAEVAFGAATDTQDAQGAVVESGEAYPTPEALAALLPRFTGDVTQRPPMYSALKQDGRRLYELARQGKTVEIPERPATVYSLRLMRETPRHGAMLDVACAKGFYVRTLCHDLGQAAGCPAHMRFLLRTRSGPFTLDTAVTLEELARAAEDDALDALLLPMETVLERFARADVPERYQKAFFNGVPLPFGAFAQLAGTPAEAGEPVRLYWRGELCAVAAREGDALRNRTWLVPAKGQPQEER